MTEHHPWLEEQEEEIPPGRRLLWWFGFYWGAQIPLLPYWPYFYWFPIGLGYVLRFFTVDGTNTAFSPLVLLGYFFYLVHLIASLLVRQKKMFRYLMIGLAITLTVNVVSCTQDLVLPEAWSDLFDSFFKNKSGL